MSENQAATSCQIEDFTGFAPQILSYRGLSWAAMHKPDQTCKSLRLTTYNTFHEGHPYSSEAGIRERRASRRASIHSAARTTYFTTATKIKAVSKA